MIDPVSSEPRPGPMLGTTIIRPGPGVVLLDVDGEIDTLTAPALEAALDELLADPDDRVLVVDLLDVTFLASSGLAVLSRAAQRAADREVRVRIVTDARAVRRPLEITGVDQLFDLYADTATAGRHD